ncbi:MAG: NAD-dependent epimerase/dehydratase [Spartobacteria bacterium]|nr:NAD-dependent epimerase/dehydratase [Spartobacteria bacterium]
MNVFVTGGTGYIGRRLIPELLERGHQVRALVRSGSEKKLSPGAEGVLGDALRADSYTSAIAPADTFVHLVGVPQPSPAKAAEFRVVDLVSIEVATKAARESGIRHFVYVSVAQPAPVMNAFIEVRRRGEELVRMTEIDATVVRPWYVLGPGHRWPFVLLPFYWVAERLPSLKESANRLGLVTLAQMLHTLVWSIENPAHGVRILGVPEIRRRRKA